MEKYPRRRLLQEPILAICFIILATTVAAWPAGEPETSYRIETLAGNGKPGDIPKGGGTATEIPVDLPFGVENGPDRALYITTVGSHRVLRLDRKSRQITSVAGTGRKGYSGDGGPAIKAELNEPYEVHFDSHGNMLILEMVNHVLRKVDAKSGTITTLAGDGIAGDRGDGGPANKARFRHPHSIQLDAQDNIYISDLENHRVRRIDAKTGRIETIVGNGKKELPNDGGIAREEPFLTPQGLVVRGDNLWIASVSGQSLWRLDLKRGTIHRVAGTGKRGHTGDGGDPLQATFDGPRGMSMSKSGVIYLAEGENNIIRAIDTVNRSIRTVAGVGPNDRQYNADGIPATKAPIWQPHGVCVAEKGALIISDTNYCLSVCSGDFNDWARKVASTDSDYSFMFTIEWEMPYFNMGSTFNYAEMAYLIAPRPFMVERGHHDGVAPDEWVASEYAKVRWVYDNLGLAGRTALEFFNGGHTINGEGTFDFLHQHLKWPKRADAFLGSKAGDERKVRGVKLCWCPPSKFTMGSPRGEPERRADEAQVEVTLTKGFWMGKYEVTQGQWKQVMGKLPGELTAELPEGDNFPVGNVNYTEAEEYCSKLTEMAQKSGDVPKGWEFRLPTEAQWEYACRAGTKTATAFADKLSSKQANFQGKPYNGAKEGPSLKRAAKVGSYSANAWGLHDMHGNVYEWCRDWYHEKLPGGADPDLSAVQGTRNRDGTFSRVRRGGAWCDDGWACRSAFRLRYEPERRYDHIGFRVAVVPQSVPD